MKIVCSSNMPYAMEAFRQFGEVVLKPGRAITAADARDADALMIRSTTRVSRALLEGSRVRFVGTATIGVDHMDVAWMDSAGIRWCSAPGCNANSVSEYVTAALLCIGGRRGIALEGRTLGVIGVGNVGSRVVKKAEALGMRVLMNDPPRQAAEGGCAFTGLEALLRESDAVTLHVPMEKQGLHPTWHMAGNDFFKAMKPGAIFLNAARGAVVDSPALLRAMDAGRLSAVVLDTWEHEPEFPLELLLRVDLGTPHIAGHSFEGKVMGTLMVYREFCRHLGVAPTWTPDALLPAPAVPELALDAAGRPDEDVLREAVRAVYDIERDDRDLRAGCPADGKARAEHFEGLRLKYWMRREFQYTRLNVAGGTARLAEKLARLGFAAGGLPS
ncbi:MAG: 4-phosphoerythronate dehydrogenase PdxB [Lentisphaerae bacterium]|nr:4-phosphoerythronate dehydrogenase PdxB [Lentisphaerota bacterium]